MTKTRSIFVGGGVRKKKTQNSALKQPLPLALNLLAPALPRNIKKLVYAKVH